jgi:hypothetical protein
MFCFIYLRDSDLRLNSEQTIAVATATFNDSDVSPPFANEGISNRLPMCSATLSEMPLPSLPMTIIALSGKLAL